MAVDGLPNKVLVELGFLVPFDFGAVDSGQRHLPEEGDQMPLNDNGRGPIARWLVVRPGIRSQPRTGEVVKWQSWLNGSGLERFALKKPPAENVFVCGGCGTGILGASDSVAGAACAEVHPPGVANMSDAHRN